MKKTLSQHIVPALLAFVLFFTTFPFMESVLRLHSQSLHAIQWHGVKILTPTIQPGQTLELVYSATVNKQCPSDLRGFLIAADQTVPVRFPVLSGGYRIPSPNPVDIPVKIVIPVVSDLGLAPLKSGPYLYRTIATRYCHDGVEEDHLIPDAPFYLEVPHGGAQEN